MYEVNGAELRARMAKSGYTTIEAFSRDTGINRNTLSQILKGRASPGTQVITIIAEKLGFSSEEIGEIFFSPRVAR